MINLNQIITSEDIAIDSTTHSSKGWIWAAAGWAIAAYATIAIKLGVRFKKKRR